jgi:hypothetical protein
MNGVFFQRIQVEEEEFKEKNCLYLQINPDSSHRSKERLSDRVLYILCFVKSTDSYFIA